MLFAPAAESFGKDAAVTAPEEQPAAAVTVTNAVSEAPAEVQAEAALPEEQKPAKAVILSEDTTAVYVTDLRGDVLEDEEAIPEPEEALPEEIEAERRYIAQNPELAAMGAVIPEGSDVPVAECDAGFHKYVASLMRNQGMTVSLNKLALPVTLNAIAISGADSLIHQERFANCIKTFGTDVSEFQGNIDWVKVKAAGIDFCILRAGYRGYGKKGTLVLDPKFVNNLKNAKAAGLKVGVYFFTQAITVAEAKEEADFVYQYIKGYSLDLPVYCDMEEIYYDTGRLDSANLTMAQKTAIIEAFCDRILALGYEAGVYSNPSWMTYYLDRAKLEAKYPIWLANYVKETKYQYKFNIWQYDTGTINGISGATDMDVKYDPAVPGTVTGFTCTGATSNSLTFKWDEQENPCQSYQVVRYDPTNMSYTVVGTTNTCTFTLKNLQPLTSAQYTVRGLNTFNGKSYLGQLCAAVKTMTLCTPVSELKAEASGRSLAISWKSSDASLTHLVYVGSGSAAPICVGMVQGESYVYPCKEGAYTVFIRSCLRSGGKLLGQNDSASVNVSVGAVRAEAEIRSVGKDSITIGWNNAVTADKCRIYWIDEKSGSELLIDEVNASAGEYVCAGLKLSERYTYRVDTLYGGNVTESSALLTAVTRNGLAGDLNSDGKVNMQDMWLLKMYLNGKAKIDTTNADLNCDKVVDDKDLEMFARIIAGSSEKMV